MRKPENEASAVGSIRGAQLPLGMDPEKPRENADAFENLVVKRELNEEDFEETVRKRGDMWVHFDDKTGAELGSYKDREVAWEKQRQRRRSRSKSGSAKDSVSLAPKGGKSNEKVHSAQKSKVAPGSKSDKGKITKEAAFEHLKGMVRNVLHESAISYVFEQPQSNEDSLAWDRFVGSLSKESIMSDQKLKNILAVLQKSEMSLLNKAAKVLRDTLSKRGFEVKNMKGVKTEDGSTAVKIHLFMPENKKTIEIIVAIENGKPLINLPDQTRTELNTIANDESKLLRAELIHVQEIELDKMDDVVKASDKRDKYLSSLEGKVEKIVRNLGPLEVALLKNLLKQKYKGVR